MTLSLLSLLAGPELARINEQLQEINMKLTEVAESLRAVDAQLEKAKGEILDRIAELEAALGDTALPEDAAVALERLSASAQALDDIVPDAEPL